ncbi:MAG: DUF4336 domain-containing protein [Chlorogloeopsis fritschii C42_A2020_084]|uniref:DUF4336 domain-containing protein n=1 Tax=Chlorogloeopsis fritschii TaxID=1124 RepID=UPI0019DA466A|nr:DUF4336 domain-containing protein [Chlorogloeopsis fritschii]MBF2004516.1 DUF4336 domain-containing protein [Chlorogloeopsis fritschii C42_A2020_084]
MLREIDTSIWVAEQPFKYFGLSVGTRMTVIRLVTGELVVISPIQVDDATIHQLNELGNVSHIIAPNLYHYLFTANFKALYPSAILWATPGLEIKKPELSINQVINTNTRNFLSGIECLLFDGFRTLSLNGFAPLNECVFFHAESRTLVLTDTAFNFDESFPLVTQFATRVLGGYKSLSPSLLERVATREKEKVRQAVQRVLAWDFERVIMAHGSIVEKNGKEKFKQGYKQFLG